ncbi:MAG: hypothetical protein ABI262_14800 [Microcoleus sp.]
MATQPITVLSGCFETLSLALSRSKSAKTDCIHATWHDINGAFNIPLKGFDRYFYI